MLDMNLYGQQIKEIADSQTTPIAGTRDQVHATLSSAVEAQDVFRSQLQMVEHAIAHGLEPEIAVSKEAHVELEQEQGIELNNEVDIDLTDGFKS